MATKREPENAQQSAEAETKLTRLLETETELESLLAGARARAVEITDAAKQQAARRLGELARELEQQDADLRDRIARERDDAIQAIRTAASQRVDRLNGIPDDLTTDIARKVLTRLLGARDTGGSR